MLLIGFFKSAKECLQFYNSKRFNKETYGVDQPCQLRYLNYISSMMEAPKMQDKLICYRLKGITHRGLTDENYYINITSTRSQQLIHEKVRFNRHVKESSKILIADIFIELFCEIWSGSKRVTRMNCNLYFLKDATKLKIKGEDVRVSGGHTN